MDHAELLERAKRDRTLAAALATDEQTSKALLDLAEEYETLATDMSDDDPWT